MSGSVNKVILVGRLRGKDPEVKYTLERRCPVAKFSLATDEKLQRPNGRKAKPEPSGTTLWRGTNWPKFCGEYLTKGKLVYIEGSIRSRQWQ